MLYIHIFQEGQNGPHELFSGRVEGAGVYLAPLRIAMGARRAIAGEQEQEWCFCAFRDTHIFFVGNAMCVSRTTTRTPTAWTFVISPYKNETIWDAMNVQMFKIARDTPSLRKKSPMYINFESSLGATRWGYRSATLPGPKNNRKH